MNLIQQNTVAVLAAMQQVNVSEDVQVQVLTSCLAALCCARARTPAQAHQLAMECENDLHARIDDAWRQADPILKALKK